MSKKNSNVNLKNFFKDFKDLSKIYTDFKKKLDTLKKKKYLVAISGGPDSLALAALSKSYSYQNNSSFHYILVDHNLRKNSDQEAKKVKKLLKKKGLVLKFSKIKKK